MSNDPLGGAAQHEMPQAGVSMRGHYDQVDLLVGGEAADFLERPAFHQMDVLAFDRDSVRLSNVIELAVQIGNNSRFRKNQRNAGDLRDRMWRFENVNQMDFGIEMATK